jgi:uncharacterized protein (TIGR02246 family)
MFLIVIFLLGMLPGRWKATHGPPPVKEPRMSAESSPVTDALEAYSATVLAKDLDAFLDLYADDVVVFDGWQKWEYRGTTEWRPAIEAWFAGLGEKTCEVRFSEISATVGDYAAFAHAFVRYAGVNPDGSEAESMMQRLTIGLTKFDGDWKITHEHTSLPLDMKSGNPIVEP